MKRSNFRLVFPAIPLLGALLLFEGLLGTPCQAKNASIVGSYGSTTVYDGDGNVLWYWVCTFNVACNEMWPESFQSVDGTYYNSNEGWQNCGGSQDLNGLCYDLRFGNSAPPIWTLNNTPPYGTCSWGSGDSEISFGPISQAGCSNICSGCQKLTQPYPGSPPFKN